MRLMKLAPNFEISLYLAQAMGASVVTDSIFRWNEMKRAMRRSNPLRPAPLASLAAAISGSAFGFPPDPADIQTLAASGACQEFPALMRDTYKYLTRYAERGAKPNVEQNLAARFARAHTGVEKHLATKKIWANQGRIQCVFPAGGIQDNNVNRLLLMSSSEDHLPNVPMAFYMTPDKPIAPRHIPPFTTADSPLNRPTQRPRIR